MNKWQIASLGFVANRFFIKLFNTSDIEIEVFRFCSTYSVQLSKRAAKFENRLRETTVAADLYLYC